MKLIQSIFGKNNEVSIGAPVKGKLISIKTVNDSTFSDEILGKGIAIIPSEGKVYASDSGTVNSVFPTGHAVTMTTDSGAELLIHIGLDTVKLDGKYYTIHAKDGQRVSKGDLLLEADIEQIKASGYEVITPVVVCNSDEFSQIWFKEEKEIAAGEVIMTLKK